MTNPHRRERLKGWKHMYFWRVVVLVLCAAGLLFDRAWAQPQVKFLQPMVAVNQTPAPQGPKTPVAQGPKEVLADEFGLTPPTRDQLFRVQSEQALKDRLRQELPKVKKVEFPKGATPIRETPSADLTPFPERVVFPISGDVCYRPLYFEDKRTERFGHYVPCVQPLLSAGRFYGGVLILPYRMWMAPPWTFECDNR